MPVLLSSFIFGGILAKYNNEMNLNKAILESAYQPMKQQYRECSRAQNLFRRKLTGFQAFVGGLQEYIQHGVMPPATFWKQIEHSAYNNNVTSPSHLEETWEDVMACYGTFGSLLEDMSIMLGGKAQEDLDSIIERRNTRLESLIREKNGIFKKLYSYELDGLSAGIREASAVEIKKKAPEWGNTLKKAMAELKDLEQIIVRASDGQNKDFDSSDAIAAKALRKRFETGPFDFFHRTA